MKEFTVSLGGKDRRLRYTSRDGVALFQRFKKPLPVFFQEDVLGYYRETYGAGINPEALAAVLQVGLAHDWPRITDDQVLDLLDQHYAAGGKVVDVIWPAVSAAYYSGIVTGESVDFDAKKAEAEAAEAAGGKAEPATPASS